jgi:uncharacterized protein with ParB-like and HNH nuclease domain
MKRFNSFLRSLSELFLWDFCKKNKIRYKKLKKPQNTEGVLKFGIKIVSNILTLNESKIET